MPKDITDVNGNPAIETDEPLSIQEANKWALKARKKASPKKDTIEKLRCAAAKRRERSGGNPVKAKDSDISYKAKGFNPESDAFNIESSEGKKLLGQSLSNGNVKNGQKVRSFFDPNGKVVIDVKPKGRDILIPKSEPKIVKDKEVWPVTSCFLYSRIKAIEEDLTDNLATDLTSYDAYQSWDTQNPLYNPAQSSSWNTTNAPPIKNTVFVQRPDLLGDYETAQDALNNNLKADRTFVPPSGGSGDGGGADNSAWGEGSESAVTAWFYIGDMTGFQPVERNIFYARGNGYGSWSGPNYSSPSIPGPSSPCMTMYSVGAGAIEALYASFAFGSEPLSKYLKNSFPDLGGKIGYWGGIQQWHGVQDMAGVSTRYDRRYNINDPFRQPTSQPPDYPGRDYPAPPQSPWTFQNYHWYRFGWPDVTLSCTSEPGNIRVYNYGVDPFSSAAGFTCGGDIAPDNWSGYRLGTHSTPWMQYNNPSSKNGMFVCWQGHLANLAQASAFCSALQSYFNIDYGRGGVRLLGSCNPYGCKGSDGGGYPKAPVSQRVRIVAKQFGHKAEIWLKVCDKEKPPIELKLPFEFAAVVTKMIAQNGVMPGGQATQLTVLTAGGADTRTSAAECPHATMAVDKDFIYIDILYGGEREWAIPQVRPVPTMVSQTGSGTLKHADFSESDAVARKLGLKESNPRMLIVGEYGEGIQERWARYKADYFAYCQSFKIALPKSSTGNKLTIVESQRYRRGQVIQITERSPDNEFNNKFLICDFRTDMMEEELISSSPLYNRNFQGSNFRSISSVPNPEYASFGGLPALLQGRKVSRTGRYYSYGETLDETLAYFNAVPKFYKPQSTWTDMDKIHFQLQESPRMFWPLNTILPPGEFVTSGTDYNRGDVILFDDNGRFGKHGRASAITRSTDFGDSVRGSSPRYGDTNSLSFLLYTSFKEQLIGNGLKDDAGRVVRWNRVSTSSFPIFGQISRN